MTELPVRRKLLLAVVALMLVVVWTATAFFSSVGITYLRTGTAAWLNLADLPNWQPPVCVIGAFLVMGALVWGLRLIQRPPIRLNRSL